MCARDGEQGGRRHLTQFLGAELTGQDGHQESDPRADEEGQDPRASGGPDQETNDGPQGREGNQDAGEVEGVAGAVPQVEGAIYPQGNQAHAQQHQQDTAHLGGEEEPQHRQKAAQHQ